MGTVYYDEDMAELLVEVQDAFGFTLTEADPLPITTVGQLYFVVLEKLGSPPSRGCVSSAAFYRFRRAAPATAG